MTLTRTGAPNHDTLAGVSTSDHHVLAVAGDFNLADLAEKLHASLASIGAGDHHTATVAGDLSLADLAEKLHASLTSVGVSDHHPDATLVKVTVETQTAAQASGDQSYSGVGFVPGWCICVYRGNSDTDSFGIGFADNGVAEGSFFARALNGTLVTDSATGIFIDNHGSAGSDKQQAVFKTFDADGGTLTWTKVNNGEGCEMLFLWGR